MADRMNGREYDAKVQRYREHLYEVSKTHDDIIVAEAMYADDAACNMRHQGAATRGRFLGIPIKIVEITEVKDEESYAVALHEFGHQIAPDGFINHRPLCFCPKHRGEITLTELYNQFIEELAAWAWAKDNAVEWTDAMQQACNERVGSYQRTHAQIQAERAA